MRPAGRRVTLKLGNKSSREEYLMNKHMIAVALAAVMASGCTAQQHAGQVRAAEETNRLTVGTVPA